MKDSMDSIRPYAVAMLAVLVTAFAAGTVLAFPQADSAATLQLAEGELHDVTELDAEPHWTMGGEWQINCGPAACADAPLGAIDFDLAVYMVRPDGASSHAHSFDDFEATSVVVDGDNIFIDGTIVGSGAVGGLTDISITIIGVSDGGDFRVELVGNTHIIGELGGVVVRSR